MKKTILICTIFIFHHTTSFGQSNSIPIIDFDFEDFRALHELNHVNNAEAYPWISEDGLRIYYTLRFGGNDYFAMAERNQDDGTFNQPTLLSINSEDYDSNSAWLTADELNIYFIIEEPFGLINYSLYHASRNSIEDPFEDPIRINLTGNFSGYINSPSLTQTLDELYLYNQSGDVRQMLIFERAQDYTYNLIDTLELPEGYLLRSGRLGQEDLKFYISLQDPFDNVNLYAFERQDIHSHFDSLYYLDNELINNNQYDNIQPYISNNGNYFVFTRGYDNSWQNNDLYIAQNNSDITLNAESNYQEVSLDIYPNPASNYITFDFSNSKLQDVTISIYDGLGVRIASNTNEQHFSKIVFDISNYSDGIYTYRLDAPHYESTVGKFMIF